MNGQFAQLAAMQPQAQMGGMPPVPPPQPGPVGGRLAQLWEAFKTDPNMRQAVLQASTAMMQSPPPGQNSFGMIGAGIQHGANTLDKLRERDRGQKVEQERFDTATGQRQQGIDLQGRSVDLQGQALEQRADESRRDRRQQARMFDANAKLQKELMGMRVGPGGEGATHPNVHLVDTLGNVFYTANPDYYENQGRERGADPLAIAKEDYIHKMHGVREDPHLASELKARTFSDWFKERTKDEKLFGNPVTAEEIQGVLALLETGFAGTLQPGAPRVSQPSVRSEQPPMGQNQAPWPPGPMNPLVGGDARGIPPPGGREIEQWRTIANAGVTVRNEVTQNPVRLTYEGNTFYFIEIDRTTGKELGRQAASTPEIQAFVKASGR